MNLMKDETPRNGQIVIVYFKEGEYVIAMYTKVWSWKGLKPIKKMGFVNARRGYTIPMKNIMGWNRIPQHYETVGGVGAVDHEVDAEDIVCGWKNTINPIDSEIYKNVMWKVTKKHHRVISFTDNEFFAMVRMIKKHFINKEVK